MEEFIKARDERISKLGSLGHRNINIEDLKRYMKAMGYTRRCLGCGITITGRKRTWCCDEHKNNFYNQYFWSYIRDRVLEKHPMCQMCDKKKSKDVHHIEPIKQLANIGIRGDPWDEDNLIALCNECHVKAQKNLTDKHANVIKRRKMKTPGLEAYGFEHQMNGGLIDGNRRD